MAKEDTLSTPVIVEEDGWTLASGSSDRPTEEKLREALGAAPAEAPTEEPVKKPAKKPDGEPPSEEPAAEPVAEPDEEQPAAEPEGEEAPDEEAAPAPAAKRRRAHDPQRRIDKLSGDLKTEQERTSRLEAELAELRRRAPAPPEAAPPEPPRAARPPADGLPPKPVWGGPDGFEAQGKTWEEYEDAKEEYNAAFFRHEVASALAQERTRSNAEAIQQQADAAYLSRIEALRAKRPDYDQVIENLGDLDSAVLKHLIYYSHDGPAIGLHLAEHVDQAETLAQMEFSRPIVDTVRRSAAPVKLLEHFALHPEEVQNLMRLDPVSCIAAIGRLEARLDVGHTVTTAAARPVTSARPPLRTVGGGAPLARTASPAPSSADIPFSPEYIARANEEDALTARRRRGY